MKNQYHIIALIFTLMAVQYSHASKKEIAIIPTQTKHLQKNDRPFNSRFSAGISREQRDQLKKTIENIDKIDDYDEFLKIITFYALVEVFDKFDNNNRPNLDNLVKSATSFIFAMTDDLFSSHEKEINDLFKKTVAILPLEAKYKFLANMVEIIDPVMYIAAIQKLCNQIEREGGDFETFSPIFNPLLKRAIQRRYFGNTIFFLNDEIKKLLTDNPWFNKAKNLLDNKKLEDLLKKKLSFNSRTYIYERSGFNAIFTPKEKFSYHNPYLFSGITLAFAIGFTSLKESALSTANILFTFYRSHPLLAQNRPRSPFIGLPIVINNIGILLQNLMILNKVPGGMKRAFRDEAFWIKTHPCAFICSMAPMISDGIFTLGKVQYSQDISTLRKLRSNDYTTQERIMYSALAYFHRGNIIPATLSLFSYMGPIVASRISRTPSPIRLQTLTQTVQSLFSHTKWIVQEFKNI